MNFKTFEEYLRMLKRVQTDRQTLGINTFQLLWKVFKRETKTWRSMQKQQKIPQTGFLK